MTDINNNKSSNLWYLLPIFIGFLGGIIAYFILRNKDPKKAKYCFYVGLILAIIGLLLNFIFMDAIDYNNNIQFIVIS